MSANGSFCDTCRFFVWATNEHGECRRHAPRPFVASDNGGMVVGWPGVLASDWCGEWEDAS
jgi:hypothetical protein